MNNTMKQLTPEGKKHIDSIASRYGLSQDTVLSMLQAVVNGGGKMAQFNIKELGGNGQWMAGGMTMVGDMFNHSLKNIVHNLCQELSNLIFSQNIFVSVPETSNASFSMSSMSNNWWPSDLGAPSSSGAQNNIKYAFFPSPVSRLAIEINGEVSVYDTLNHQISGVSQQQGGDFSVLFRSQLGNVNLSDLTLISGSGISKKDKAPAPKPVTEEKTEKKPDAPESNSKDSTVDVATVSPTQVATSTGGDSDIDIFNKIDRLAELLKKGIFTQEEFSAKKTELLARL